MNRFVNLITNRMSLDRAALPVFALFLLAVTALPQCLAAPPVPIFPNVVGFWFGEFVSDGGATGFSSLRIEAQEVRRFAGTFTFFPDPTVPPNPCFVRGTASDSGRISLVGRNDELTVHAHGQVTGGLMSLDFLLMFADGSFDTGTTVIAIEHGNGP